MAQGYLCIANVGGRVEAVRENLIGIEVDWEGSPGLFVPLISKGFTQWSIAVRQWAR